MIGTKLSPQWVRACRAGRAATKPHVRCDEPTKGKPGMHPGDTRKAYDERGYPAQALNSIKRP